MEGERSFVISDEDILRIKDSFSLFLRHFRENAEDEPFYMTKLSNLVNNSIQRTLVIDWHHCESAEYERVVEDHEGVFAAIQHAFYTLHPHLNQVVRDLAASLRQDADSLENPHKKLYYIAFSRLSHLHTIRQVNCTNIGSLLTIEGTVTRSSDVKPILEYATFLCRECRTTIKNVPQEFQYQEPKICPGIYDTDTGRIEKCRNKTNFKLLVEQSIFTDFQLLRVQEDTSRIPHGSTPRSIDVAVKTDNIEIAKPGDLCVLTGALIAVPEVISLLKANSLSAEVTKDANKRLRQNGGILGSGVSGLSVSGVRELYHRLCFNSIHVELNNNRLRHFDEKSISSLPFGSPLHPSTSGILDNTIDDEESGVVSSSLPASSSPSLSPSVRELHLHKEDREAILELTRRSKQENNNILSHLSELIAPQIYGLELIKKGILLMLIGGLTKKTNKDNIKLRGDINICIVGDASCAKSQLLSFTKLLANRCVYTSGKTSTAAGLTASIHRDKYSGMSGGSSGMGSGNEFVIEAGALMLADNGVCCIDSFDTMEEKDMVAIHEAMEQQTISITKAGIQATLNARASVLAACSPVGDKYDTSKTLAENVRLSAPIMSRFDLFFVIVDEPNAVYDQKLAQHILATHTKSNVKGRGEGNDRAEREGERGDRSDMMDRNTRFLYNYIRYAKTFKPAMTKEAMEVMTQYYVKLRAANHMGIKSSRITVRQLESLIRLSEAHARVRLSNQILVQDVNQAYELLSHSILTVDQKIHLEMGEGEEEGDERREERADVEGEREGEEAEGEEREGRKENEEGNQLMTLSFDEYRNISVKLLTYLDTMQLMGIDISQEQLVLWYIENFMQQNIHTTNQLTHAEKLIHMIIQRNIQKDKSIIIEVDNQNPHQRIITKHPNVNIKDL